LIFSVTSIEKFSAAPVYKGLIFVGWVCLIISTITGVWLLRKRDSLEAQWKGLKDVMGDMETTLFGLEQDFGKLITRGVINILLKEKILKDKDELQKDWLTPNGRVGIGFMKKMLSELEKSYPAFAAAKADFSREYEE
jgi:hypothetical protein